MQRRGEREGEQTPPPLPPYACLTSTPPSQARVPYINSGGHSSMGTGHTDAGGSALMAPWLQCSVSLCPCTTVRTAPPFSPCDLHVPQAGACMTHVILSPFNKILPRGFFVLLFMSSSSVSPRTMFMYSSKPCSDAKQGLMRHRARVSSIAV